MKIRIALFTSLILFANAAWATDFQGEVVEVEGDHVTLEIFGDQTFRVEAGHSVRIRILPEHLPTLDMLQG